MKTDKNYSRKSISDNKIYEISKLVRFVKNKQGEISFDENKNKPGRGAYCLASQDQLDILFNKKLLHKAFRQNIAPEVYEKLRNEVELWLNKKTTENQTLKH
ncbi:YlxR family protein [Mycoplasma struthionis]|uniref:YlxR family protein n=1 Tax=Mycoplasma struthionis TaxID=538220 RepID=A0A3G8LHT3_9MOLU|nr:YlxR family protein [Mycoplasma struthionis]AZG68420.1 YlxR family protein [Mycoplasma struthionis]TPI03017.1 YlxR family protein [Mycoplasma struthionis]